MHFGGIAGLAVVGFGVRAVQLSLSESAAPYATGYNDDFWKYAMADRPDASLPVMGVDACKGGWIGAVLDALSHLGVKDIQMPATPERVWRAIQEAKA